MDTIILKNITLLEDLKDKTQEDFSLAKNCLNIINKFFINLLKDYDYKYYVSDVIKQYRVNNTMDTIHEAILFVGKKDKYELKTIGTFIFIFNNIDLLNIQVKENNNVDYKEIYNEAKNNKLKSISIRNIYDYIDMRYDLQEKNIFAEIIKKAQSLPYIFRTSYSLDYSNIE